MDNRPLAVIADNSKPFLVYLSILLQRMNLMVLPVISAAEVLDVCRVTKPNLVTMDLAMPGLEDLEPLRSIRSDEDLADLPVIMISTYQDKNRQWEALSLGCVDVLDKPVDLRRLHNAVQRCELYPGGRRRYLRAAYARPVVLHTGKVHHQASSVTLSERGIFLQTDLPLSKGTHVDIDLPLPDSDPLRVGGSVIYRLEKKGVQTVSVPGIAIKFDRLTNNSRDRLARLVEKLLIDDLPPGQANDFIQQPS